MPASTRSGRSRRSRSSARWRPTPSSARSMPSLPDAIRVIVGRRGAAVVPRAVRRALEDVSLPHLERRGASARSSAATRGTSPARWTSTRCSAAARLVEGRHDFAAFQATGSDVATTEREVIVSSDCGSRIDCGLRIADRGFRNASPSNPESASTSIRSPQSAIRILEYEVTGDGFLRHMVRTIVGTLVEIGRGRRPVDWIGERPRVARSRGGRPDGAGGGAVSGARRLRHRCS